MRSRSRPDKALCKDARIADRLLYTAIYGVSTWRYERVLPEMAEMVGVSKSVVSREKIEVGERLLKDFAERDFSVTDNLVVWVDGIQLESCHVIGAVDVTADGHEHVLGLCEEAAENEVVARARTWSRGASILRGGRCP